MSPPSFAEFQGALHAAHEADELLAWHCAFALRGAPLLPPRTALEELRTSSPETDLDRALETAREHDAERFVRDADIDRFAGERSAERAREKGVYYTPKPLARALALLLRGASRARPESLVDPACGAGALLAAASANGVPFEQLYGVDIDPVAVEIARCRLAISAARWADDPAAGRERFVCADALARPLSAIFPDQHARGGFDALVANPPFGGAIARDTARTAEQRERYGRDFPNAARGAYDKAALFVELAVQWTRPESAIAALVPRSLLGAPAARALRAWLEEVRPLSAWLRIADGALFRGASVHVAGILLAPTRGALHVVDLDARGTLSRYEVRSAIAAHQWAARTSPYAEWLRILRPATPLGQLAEVRASLTVAEAYDVAARVREDGEPAWTAPLEFSREQTAERPTAGPAEWQLELFGERPPRVATSDERAVEASAEQDARPDVDAFRWITSGAIDPLELAWGAGVQRYLGRHFVWPMVDRHALPNVRARLAAEPKILIPGLSAVLEAACDEAGHFAGAVATLSVLRRTGVDAPTLPFVALYLNTAPARAWFLAHYAPLALSGGSVQVTANKLRELPVPDALWRGPLDANAGERLLGQVAPPLPRKHAPPVAWWDDAKACAAQASPAAWRACFRQLALDERIPLDDRLALASVAVLGCTLERQASDNATLSLV